MKGDVKPMKSVAVGAASAVSQYLIAAPLNSALSGATGFADAPYLLDLLAETLGIGITLSAFEAMNLAKKSDTEVSGDKRKGMQFAKAWWLAVVDVGMAELLLLMMGGNQLLLGKDPAASTTATTVASVAPTNTTIKVTK